MARLSLTRKPGEQIVIGMGRDMVFVEVTEAHRGKVVLTVDCPAHIEVDRVEVRLAKCADEFNGMEKPR